MGQEKDSSPNIEKCIQMVDLATLTQKETRAMITQKRLKGSRFDLVPELLNPKTQIHFIKGHDCNGIVRVSPKKIRNFSFTTLKIKDDLTRFGSMILVTIL